MSHVLITGGTGLIGKELCVVLKRHGIKVSLLSRSSMTDSSYPTFLWNPAQQTIDPEALLNVDAIVHLAGENIGSKRWTKKRKQEVIESRVNSGQLLLNSLQQVENNVKVFITASAIGYYGAVSTEKVYTETDPSADDFLGTTCRLWEESTADISNLGIRVVTLRMGVILSSLGGALSKLLLPVKLGLGSKLGSGNQYMPWIHKVDMVNIIFMALQNEKMVGVYNSTAPESVTNSSFIKILAKTIKKPLLLPGVPAFILRSVLGEMSKMILEGSRVSSDKLIGQGYKFEYPKLEKALDNLMNTGHD